MKKKTCDGCKALYGRLIWEMRCTLGYSTKNGKYVLEPNEKCPKPKTFKELVKLETK